MDESEKFQQLVKKFKNKTLKAEYEFLNEDFNEIYKLLPHVDRALIKEASEYCSLGFSSTRACIQAQMQAAAEDSKDGAIHFGSGRSVNLSNEGYRQMLIYRVQHLVEQIQFFYELNLYPENQNESSEYFYHYFEDDFHERLFRMIFPDATNVKRTMIPLPDLLYTLGSTLIDLGDYEAAERELHTAVTWNLTSAGTIFEYAETLKRYDMEKFLVKTFSALSVSYTVADVARAFRNFAYYYSEKKEWQNAYINLVLSSMYENNEERINSELRYIQENSDIKLQEVTSEMLEAYAIREKMPLGANPDVLNLLYTYANELFDKKDKKGSVKYFQCLYDLTRDDELKKIIKLIKSGKYKTNSLDTI